jgi:TrmH family RNA methyltransferase
VKEITSPSNPEVKALLGLRERRERERQGRFIIEGTRELTTALTAGVKLARLYRCPALLRPEAAALFKAVPPELPQVELAPAVFAKISYRDNPDGLLAVAERQASTLSTLQLPRNALVLVLDGLEKPGNLGAIIRTADGAGLDAVLLSGSGTDLENPNVIRASLGTVFSRPVIEADGAVLLAWLRQEGFSLIAASPHASASYWDADFTGQVAIVLGAEHAGLSPAWLTAAEVQVGIPMRGLADSLNVATAGALLIYEALRQRR